MLRLVLEDLNDGIIGIGAATTRGYGSVQIAFSAAEGGLPATRGRAADLAGMVRGDDYPITVSAGGPDDLGRQP